MRTRAASLILALLFAASTMAQDGRRPMTVDDALDLVSVGGALMSPDGSQVFDSEDFDNSLMPSVSADFFRLGR